MGIRRRRARRTSTNASTTESSAGTFALPYWLRVRRIGNTLSSWRSPDGFAWTQVSSNQTVTMGATVQAGLAVASLSGGDCTATFDNISVTGTANVAPTIATQPSAIAGAGNTAALTVLGADADGGESNLTYTWDVLGVPPGGVTYGTNATNGSKNVTATFGAAGLYQLQVRVADSGGSVIASNILPVLTGAPTLLSATGGNAAVSLTWTAPSPSATSYNIKRSTVSGGTYTTVGTTGAINFTDSGLTNGPTYFYVVSAVNGASETQNSTQLSATPSSFAGWQQTWFNATQLANPLISGANADANGDGFKNLLAYAFNVSPWANLAPSLPTAQITGGYLTLTYTRRKAPTDVTYTVEVSSNLATWNSGATYTTETSVTPLDASTERVTVRDNILASAGRRFIHVVVTYQP